MPYSVCEGAKGASLKTHKQIKKNLLFYLEFVLLLSVHFSICGNLSRYVQLLFPQKGRLEIQRVKGLSSIKRTLNHSLKR